MLLAQVDVGRHDEGAEIKSDDESNEPLVGNRLPLDRSWIEHGINEGLLVRTRLCRQLSLRDKSFEHRSVPLRRMIPGRIIGEKTSSLSTRLEQGLRIVASFHCPVHCRNGKIDAITVTGGCLMLNLVSVCVVGRAHLRREISQDPGIGRLCSFLERTEIVRFAQKIFYFVVVSCRLAQY